MENLDYFNNYSDSVCVFSKDNKIVFKNKAFLNSFYDCSSFESFKKRFNFNFYFLSSENIQNQTPIDLLIQSKENFHTVCTYQNINDDYIYYYVYSFKKDKYLVVIFRDITSFDKISTIEKKYTELQKLYSEVTNSAQKYSKLQEQAQSQMLKMAILNRFSLVIRETNDIETVLASALDEINNLLGSFKTYFLMKDKTGFKVTYSALKNDIKYGLVCKYEEDVIQKIKSKEIYISPCLKECLNSDVILPNGTKRIIIPVYNKNKLLGIIVSLTAQKINIDENKEILQSISVQLASSIIQAGLIQQLNKKNKKLEKTLSELKSTQMQLINTEKMASLGQLVSGVAHEINTPLSAISSNNKLINKILLENRIDEEQYELLKELNSIDIEAAQRISDIVISLKKFVRLDEAEFQQADINSELDLTLKLLTHELKSNIEIVKNYGNIPPVLCSVNMLNQVFMNILLNACHSIREKNSSGKITITTQTNNNNLVVKIKDNGCGIPHEIQNKIFSVGFTTKKSGIGTGLGLSISKKIIEIHKGEISFMSKEGEGTEFIVSIPLISSKE